MEASDGEFVAFRNLAITVLDVFENQPPAFGESNATFATMEGNGSHAYFTHAHDPDANATLTYSLTGPDADKFILNAVTGEVSFKQPPDHESPADLDQDGLYEVTILVSDGFASSAQNLTVQVDDDLAEDSDNDGYTDGEELAEGTDPANSQSKPNRAPENLTLDNAFVDEAQPAGALVGHLHAFDPDANDTIAFALADGNGSEHNHLFRIDANGTLLTEAILDHEANATVSIRVRAADEHNASIEQVFLVHAQNVFIPIVKTFSAGEVTHDRAELSGQLLADGFSEVTEMGVIVSRDWWFSESDPSTRRLSAVDHNGSFEVQVDGLDPDARYYFQAYAENAEGISYGAKKRFTTPVPEAKGLWADARTVGHGWLELPWFGYFQAFENGWIYHGKLGWLFAQEAANGEGLWLWSKDMGWLWTSEGSFPYLYRDSTQSWLYFLDREEGSAAFYDFRFEFWFTTDQLGDETQADEAPADETQGDETPPDETQVDETPAVETDGSTAP